MGLTDEYTFVARKRFGRVAVARRVMGNDAFIQVLRNRPTTQKKYKKKIKETVNNRKRAIVAIFCVYTFILLKKKISFSSSSPSQEMKRAYFVTHWLNKTLPPRLKTPPMITNFRNARLPYTTPFKGETNLIIYCFRCTLGVCYTRLKNMKTNRSYGGSQISIF